MSDLLAGLLSAPAAELYQRLLRTGQLPMTEAAEVEELVEAGFARKRFVGEPRIVPVEPSRAVDQALITVQRQLLDQHRMIVRAREQMQALQKEFVANAGSDDNGISVHTDPAEIGALSVELCLSAERDFSNLETEHYRNPPDGRSAKVPPAAVLERGVQFRNIYSRPVLDLPFAGEMVRRCAEGGWQLRVLPELPMKMVLVDDRAALLPLDRTGMEGAVLVRAPVVVAALRMFFEMLWNNALPLHDNETVSKFSAHQRTVLRLMIGGMTDAAIARHLDVSERTVRRHISAALDLLGVDNRITATAMIVRDGWLD
ncbi:LuxR C-terminal-related transcriptional regulator [Lentzea sp. NPDC051838]|uniref:LuxR C-terminal-related transcriptional regulator n=1 Tax=Lentzea sp. NPDC051838 TaxID=3154849 RepID=UPI003417A5EE